VPVDVKLFDNVGVTRAELWVNGTKVITDDTNRSPSFGTLRPTPWLYTLVAKAYDAAGNVGTSSSVSVTVANDTTAPVISSFNLMTA
jgi:hypothetical protein